MNEQESGTAGSNGRLWGGKAEDWATLQEPVCLPVYEAAWARLGVQAGDRVLDAGCGAGLAAERAAARGARVWGLDAAEGLLLIAQKRVPTGVFCVGELERMPYEDGAFDVVTGFNSFQYAADAEAALREARRVTRVGGAVLVMVLGPQEEMEAGELIAALVHLLPELPAGTPGPFALSGKGALRALAVAAGLQAEQIFDVEAPWRYPDLGTAVRGLGSTGVAARAEASVGAKAVDAAHRSALARFRQTDGSYRVGASFRCLLCRA